MSAACLCHTVALRKSSSWISVSQGFYPHLIHASLEDLFHGNTSSCFATEISLAKIIPNDAGNPRPASAPSPTAVRAAAAAVGGPFGRGVPAPDQATGDIWRPFDGVPANGLRSTLYDPSISEFNLLIHRSVFASLLNVQEYSV